MKHRAHLATALLIASTFWFFDSAIHYILYDESHFEWIPDDFNELWMRVVICALIMLFGLYADYSYRKLINKEKQLEAAEIYRSMVFASHHILNNLLNQMQLFRIEASRCRDFDKDKLKLYDETFNEAKDLIHRLSTIENVSDKNIRASIDPKNIHSSR